MKGSVHKRGNRWYYRFDADPDPLTGRRRYISRGGFATRKAAWDACRAAMQEHRAGRQVKRSGRTVTEFLNEWHAAIRPALRASTWAYYRDYKDAYVIPVIGRTRLQDLTPVRLNLLYAHLLEAGRRKPDNNYRMYEFWQAERNASRDPMPRDIVKACGVTIHAARGAIKRYRTGRIPAPQPRGLAPKTVRNVHLMMRRALGDAVKWDYVPRNAAEDAEPPIARRAKPGVWTPQQLRTFVDHVRSDRFFALWLLVATTGLRRGELAGLRPQDFDLDAGRVSPTVPRVVVDGWAQESTPKTASGERWLALDPVTLQAVREYIKSWSEDRESAGHESELLFCWPDGRPIHPQTLTDWCKQHVRAAGLPWVRLHGIRHSYATAALKAGVHPKIVSERMGHSSVAFTLQAYSHVIPGMDQAAAAAIADIILGQPAGSGTREQEANAPKSAPNPARSPIEDQERDGETPAQK